ncbi:MAG TPA: non-ribosomal peptide synthetase, partial [Pyrinomonadaceae bacterium]|nr:non-ribosomal peptide synthetase [Pyrinomonadaceae bacterium]
MTQTFLPTPLAEKLLALPWNTKPSLQVLLTGGDRLQRWAEPTHTFDLVNHYGPTESTVVTSCAVVPPCPSEGSGVGPSIGKPIRNTEVYVLGSAQDLVPLGVKGELYVGGGGLARGYLGRAELTAERFVPHPFSTEPGARLYRTGDVVRYLNDGNLDFLGRADNQVKIRGHRIELGEIESVLNEHPHVRQAVVQPREDGNDELRLVAYIVLATSENGPGKHDWREFLKHRLPSYMIPAAFVTMPGLPLTENGKVDRNALPSPEPRLISDSDAPLTSIEATLTTIWREVLKTSHVGIHDNFFETGGHSLQLTQIASRVRDQLHVELPLQLLFMCPTIAELARE